MYASVRWISRSTMLVVGAFALTLTLAPALRAQTPTDGRWMAWLGGWQPTDLGAPVGGGQVCVLPRAGSSGVTFATMGAGKVVGEREVIADGRPHTIAEGGCRGSEVFEWSKDSRRLFRRAEMTCTGGNQRSMTGVLAFLPDDKWVQIEAAGVKDNMGVHVTHYGRWVAPAEISSRLPAGEELAVQTARTLVAAPLKVEDVLEANQKVSPLVLQHLVFERRNAYDLNAKALEQLAAANVSPNTIDLMVALTYPERFHIEGAMAGLAPRADTTRPRGGYGGGPSSWCFDSYANYGYYRRSYLTSFGWWPYYGYGYGPAGWYPTSYYYDPCYGGGFGPWGGYWGGGYYGGGIYYPNGGVIVVQPGNGGGGNGAPGGGTYTGRTAHPRGEGGSNPIPNPSSGRSAGSSGGSSSGGAQPSGNSGGSSAGSSGGSSGGDGGGRTAHPRHTSSSTGWKSGISRLAGSAFSAVSSGGGMRSSGHTAGGGSHSSGGSSAGESRSSGGSSGGEGGRSAHGR